jgi:hypothetical protein
MNEPLDKPGAITLLGLMTRERHEVGSSRAS